MSSYSITESAIVPSDEALSSNTARKVSAKKTHSKTSESKVKEKSSPRSDKARTDNLPVVYEFKNIISASQVLADKYPVDYDADNYEKSLRELYYVMLGTGVFAFLVYIGWAALKEINFTETGEFVYNAGLVGGILMLVALFYSAFKRLPSMRRLISADAWYYMHIGCGATGAYLIILHSSFDFRSINASVSLFSMLFVIISGALGRYLLTLSSIKLHKQYSEIKQLEPYLFTSISQYEGKKADRVRKRLSNFAMRCLNPPKGASRFLSRMIALPYHGMYNYLTSARDLKVIIRKSPKFSKISKSKRKVIKKIQRQDLRQYVFHVIHMGYMSLLEHLLRNWRILHIPLLYILTITALVHVVVVHMY